jgi:MarR family
VSVLDQFRTAEEQVAQRLRELKPLVAEYHELEQVAERLGLSVSNDAPVAGTQPPSSTEPARRRRRAPKAAGSAASKRDGGAASGAAQASGVATPARGARSPRGSAGNSRAGSSRTSRRQQDVLRLVKQRPGITVSEIARELGVDATGLYRPVHKLEQDGAIVKRGVTLQPTSG